MIDDCPRSGGDRLGREIGLLRGDAALLDREPGRVADRVEVGEALHATERVGRDEAVCPLLDPRDAWDLERGQRHYAVRVDGPAADQQKPAVDEGLRCGWRDEPHSLTPE